MTIRLESGMTFRLTSGMMFQLSDGITCTRSSPTRHAGLDPASALFFLEWMDSDWQPCVYILARASHSTLYTGVTSNLAGRVWQHREGVARGFTQRYAIKRLVWFEVHDTMEQAIVREKRIKRWPRAWKYELIHSVNPTWRDLAEDFGFDPLPVKLKADPGSSPG